MTAQQLFLLATERSGSNLLRSILDAHSEISAPHPYGTGIFYTNNIAPPSELSEKKTYKLVRDIIISKENSRTSNPKRLNQNGVYERLDTCSDSPLAYEKALFDEYASIEGSTHWCNKNPSLPKNIERVLDFYSNPTFVYLVRDPRDVVLSFKNSNVGDYHPVFTARRWRDEQTNVLGFMDEHEEDFHIVKYEDVLREPEQTVQSLCKDVGVDFEEEMLQFYRTDQAKQLSERSKDMHRNLTNPIQRDNFGKFRDQLPEKQIQITEKITRKQMKRLEYDSLYDDKLEDVRIDEESAAVINAKASRRMNWEYWKDNPRENIHSLQSTAFKRYIFFRYGLLEGHNITAR